MLGYFPRHRPPHCFCRPWLRVNVDLRHRRRLSRRLPAGMIRQRVPFTTLYFASPLVDGLTVGVELAVCWSRSRSMVWASLLSQTRLSHSGSLRTNHVPYIDTYTYSGTACSIQWFTSPSAMGDTKCTYSHGFVSTGYILQLVRGIVVNETKHFQ